MASRLALSAAQPKVEPERVPQRLRRHRRERDERWRKEAHRHRFDNGPGTLLRDPDYFAARGVGWDVLRKDLRKPEPPTQQRNRNQAGILDSYTAPNPYYDPAAVDPVPSQDCATWLWWKGLTPAQRHAFYELTHEGEPPQGVVVLNMGLEITNPAIVVEVW